MDDSDLPPGFLKRVMDDVESSSRFWPEWYFTVRGTRKPRDWVGPPENWYDEMKAELGRLRANRRK